MTVLSPAGHRLIRIAADYAALTKPRIIELLLVTTVPTMLLAAHGHPAARLVAVTLVGGTLAAASANVLNCYLDRDIDALMRRTARRPLHRHAITPLGALVFGLLLGVAALILLALTTNVLSAILAGAAIAFYVGVYTAVLKRRTSSNIVWGGAAGCMPVLIGWSAVTDSLAWAPVVLFAVVFLWTPPHFWALAIRYRDDYANAGVPMLPVVATEA
ncbi:MAG: protoheme farnesyltransferase, partial [Frankiales bacterium]|nr:protoheme farnesyltransferase [Frankiales bacterium]